MNFTKEICDNWEDGFVSDMMLRVNLKAQQQDVDEKPVGYFTSTMDRLINMGAPIEKVYRAKDTDGRGVRTLPFFISTAPLGEWHAHRRKNIKRPKTAEVKPKTKTPKLTPLQQKIIEVIGRDVLHPSQINELVKGCGFSRKTSVIAENCRTLARLGILSIIPLNDGSHEVVYSKKVPQVLGLKALTIPAGEALARQRSRF